MSRALHAAGLAAALIGAATAWSAPITFNTALPVHDGGFVVREQLVFEKRASDPAGSARDERASGLVSVLGYGVTHRFALFGVLPYFDKQLDATAAGVRTRRGEDGFGDLTVIGRYTAYANDGPGRTFRVAPFFGVKAPTGDDDARDALGRLPPSLQSGSGSWDFSGGAVATYQTLDYQVDAQLAYRVNREANAFRAGNVASIDASLQYRLWPGTLGAGVPAFVYGVIEASIVHAEKNRAAGVRDQNSGGTSLFLTPGVQYVTKQWILEAGVKIPVAQDLNGTALESDYAVTAGFRVNF